VYLGFRLDAQQDVFDWLDEQPTILATPVPFGTQTWMAIEQKSELFNDNSVHHTERQVVQFKIT